MTLMPSQQLEAAITKTQSHLSLPSGTELVFADECVCFRLISVISWQRQGVSFRRNRTFEGKRHL